MSQSDSSASASSDLPTEQNRDLEAALRARTAIMNRRKPLPAADPADPLPRGFLPFASQCNFFVTINYLTDEQAKALINWYLQKGMVKLQPLEGPEGGPTPRMYELLSTTIHFGTPRQAFEPSLEFGLLDFFSGLADAVGDLVSTVADGVTEVLNAGTGLLHAATEFVHELHELAVAAPF
jgi:hypothetical protein